MSADTLTISTKAKAAALRTGLAFAPKYQPLQMADLATLLAMLTSQAKDEREAAKETVREIVRAGAAIQAAERNAADLAHFANRHEP